MSIMDSLEKELSIYLNEKYSQSFVKSNIKNIIYFLNDDFSNNSETEREELSKVTRYLLSTNWSVLSRDNMIEDLTYTTKSGKIKKYDEPFEPRRIRGLGNTRTGVIKINICEENKQKIRDRYHISDIGPFIAIIDAIEAPGADHSRYEEFNSFIRKNRDKIIYLTNLFKNKDSDENELFEVIDKALDSSEKVSKGQFSGGASSK